MRGVDVARAPFDPASVVPHPRPDDVRLAQHVRAFTTFDACAAGDIVVIGVPDDRGVVINRGRAGAAAGPAAFRDALYRLTLGPQHELARLAIWDAGDIRPGVTNAETHDDLAAVVEAVCRRGALPIVIGGGHDNTYGGITGAAAVGPIGVINIDAHLDLRPNEPDGQIGSGTPFRRLLDAHHLTGEQLIEFGFHAHAASAAHLDYAQQQRVRLWSWEDRGPEPARLFAQFLQTLRAACGRIAVSLDLDAIVAASAPGVSAPAAFGFSTNDALAVCQLAGADRAVQYVDVMELNPTYDLDGRTARLAAVLIWSLLRERART